MQEVKGLTTKEIKQKFSKFFKEGYRKFYPCDFLGERGFARNCCSKCGKFFWNVDSERKVCGDSNCVGMYSFIGKQRGRQLGYGEVWELFRASMG